MNLLIGKRYDVVAELGDGAFGEVFRVVDRNAPAGSPELALKMMSLKRLDDAPSKSRFKREIGISAGLSHPNVIRILDSGIEDDVPWYVMPLATGGSLLTHVQPGGLPSSKAIEVFEPITNAVAFLHANGVLHRDLSPNNVLRVANEWVISDFGLSISADFPSSYQTATDVSGYGSPAFVPPEQLAHLRDATERSDVFSLGKLLQFLSEGTWPVHPPSQTKPFASVIGRATRMAPNERFASAADVLAAARVIATAPPPSGSIADRVDAFVGSRGAGAASTGKEATEILVSLDPGDEYERGEVQRILSAMTVKHWDAAWRDDEDRTRAALENACRATRDEAEWAKLDGLLHGLLSADRAVKDAGVRHSVVATLAYVGSNNNQFSYRKALGELLGSRTPAARAPETVAGLREAGTFAARWVLQETRLDSLPQPLRGWLADLTHEASGRE
ncbi:MAG: serine/threonine-protein kinase [Pseudolysinimonas sp.]